MPQLRPFHGIRYARGRDLAELVCPPYDVISGSDQERLRDRDAHNAVHLETGVHAGQARDYERTARAFDDWLAAGVLRRDDEPCLYVYRQDFVVDGARRRVSGVIGELALEPYGGPTGVLPHERTMPGPISDRLALMRACPVNVSPIYTIYRGGAQLSPFFDALVPRPPDARFADDAGTLHRMWVVRAPAEIDVLVAAVAGVPHVIADGHHRYETALAYRAERNGPGPHDGVMCFCVDAEAEDVTVRPYHRGLLARVDAAEVARRARARFATAPLDDDPLAALERSTADHRFALVTRGRRLLVELSSGELGAGGDGEAWRRLDVVALHDVVLPALLPEGVDELRFSTDARLVVDAVERGDWTAGVLLRPLDPVLVVDVARAGGRLPQKASYFWPKAVTGLVFRSLR
ncbi:MAG TPA: DUF1015 domain-containing protein [Actinomycetota bacterium]|nr:DUF1015 domain-containing protein [Actinomycetota bacterium]